WPIIGNGNYGATIAVLCDPNGYLSGRAAMFDRIVYEIGNSIKNEIPVTRSKHWLTRGEVEVYALFFGSGIVEVRDFSHGLSEVHVPECYFLSLRFNLRNPRNRGEYSQDSVE